MDIKVDVPDGKSGDWEVSTFAISEKAADFENVRALFSYSNHGRYVKAGTYKRLTRNNSVIMSNTPAEISDHLSFIYRAKRNGGNILVNGLGLGVALVAILESEKVESVTIIEKSEDVIALVAPSFINDKRVSIIHVDAFDWKPPKGMRYSTVWHDIFDDICSDNLPLMTKLKRKYGKRCDWQGCWAENLCKKHR